MKKPDLPETEEARLKTLEEMNVLDTLPEERFDRVTRMAKNLFHVPIALVSLIDKDRQWFKSCDGLPVTETGRDISFCGHAILGDNTFYIPNALEDQRFFDNPLVTGDPNIRFYAGHPLKAANGEKIGTLCIIDSEPKELNEEELNCLAELANTVEQELCALEYSTLDELTNLSNYQGFKLMAKHYLDFNLKQQEHSSLVYFNLKHFKQINSKHGRSEGENTLQLFASVMRASFRPFDLLARIENDEFVALLFNSDIENAQGLIAHLSTNLEKVVTSLELKYDVDFSFGLAQCRRFDVNELEDYLHQAKEDMLNENEDSNEVILT